MLVDKTNFGLVICNHANFYRFDEPSSYWSAKRISVFLCFSLVSQRHTYSITVYNRTVTNIENTVRAGPCITAIAGFILSSEINAYLKQIKVILSAVKKYRIFSLVMNRQ